MRQHLQFARITAIQKSKLDQLTEGDKTMKGSITFNVVGDLNDRRIRISRQGELDSEDLQVLAAILHEDIMLQKAIEAGQIRRTSSDPTGRGQLRDTWSN